MRLRAGNIARLPGNPTLLMLRRDLIRFGLACLARHACPGLHAARAFGMVDKASAPQRPWQDVYGPLIAGDPHRDLNAIWLASGPQVLFSGFYNGTQAADLHDIRSATKSITALLMGIAIARKLVGSPDDLAVRYLPWLSTDKQTIRLRDLLTMRSGLAANDADPQSPGNEERLDKASDWPAFINHLPMAHPPGAKYSYNSVTAFLTGQVVEAATGMKLDHFAAQTLFAPLGISHFHWRHAEGRYVTGQGNLSLTCADFAHLGRLVAERGNEEGRQVVRTSWIDACLRPRESIADVDPFADGYGYFWYTKRYIPPGSEPITVHFASGNGGNKLYLLPRHGIVLTIQSSAYNKHYGQVRSESILLATLRNLSSQDTQ